MTTTDELVTDFNEGKEIDLDKLTVGADSCGARKGQRTLDKLTTGAGSYNQRTDLLANSGELKISTAHANVRSWLRTQNVVGENGTAAATSAYTGYHQPLDVHHL